MGADKSAEDKIRDSFLTFGTHLTRLVDSLDSNEERHGALKILIKHHIASLVSLAASIAMSLEFDNAKTSEFLESIGESVKESSGYLIEGLDSVRPEFERMRAEKVKTDKTKKEKQDG